jgi:D-amino peptidase
MEGVAGVFSFSDQADPAGRYYDQAKHLVTAEVNAAVEGLLEAGVDDILVRDGHGAGAINFEELHPSARLVQGRVPLLLKQVLPIIRECAAVAIVGMHSMAGTKNGCLNHTIDSETIDYRKLNGRPIGEMAQTALCFGAIGVPMIFLSGDDAACREAEDLVPGITTVAVKQGLGRNAAISLSAPEARRRVREGIKQAMLRQREHAVAPLHWPGPYVLDIRYFHTDDADARAAQPGVERVDSQTIRLRSDDVFEIMNR